jgi:hypothetical protein
MSTPTGVAPAITDPPVPNRTTRIIPPPAAVQAKDNFNMVVMAAIFMAAATACFWLKHSVAGYVLGDLGSYSCFPFSRRKVMSDSARSVWRNLGQRS